MISRVFSSLPNRVSQSATAAYFTCNKLFKKFSYKSFKLFLVDSNVDKSWRQNGIRGCHSNQTSVTMADISVRILPALSDNYM